MNRSHFLSITAGDDSFFLSSLLSRVVFLLLFDDRFQFSSLGCCPSRILECFCVVLLWEWGVQKVMAGGGVTLNLRLDKIKKQDKNKGNKRDVGPAPRARSPD